MAEPKELSHDEIVERVSKMSDEEIQENIDNYGELRKTREGYLTGQIAMAERVNRLDRRSR